MSSEQTESTTPQPAGSAEWGAPPAPAAPRSKWTAKRTIIAVVVAVGIAAAGGVAIYAASGSVSNEQGGGPGGMGGGPMVFNGPGPMSMEGSQHGEFQNGEVTEITDDSITAKSEDGYSKTYVIDDETQMGDGIKKGDDVMIIATTENDVTTAETVMAPDTMQGRRDGNGGPPNGGGNGGPPNGGN